MDTLSTIIKLVGKVNTSLTATQADFKLLGIARTNRYNLLLIIARPWEYA